MNKLVVIGYLGIKKAYLNLPREEAISRFVKEEGEAGSDLVTEFEFEDSFGVYDAWKD